jgi:hypothetical protein
MPDEVTFAARLKKGLVRIDAEIPGGRDAEALAVLRHSLERALAQLEPGNTRAHSPFRFQLTGGRPLLFQGAEALPLEPDRLARLLNLAEVELLSGEWLELDGELAAWLIRPEMNLADSNLRRAEETLKGLKTGRDRDHSAAQSADSMKIRLRSRLTHLVSALQAAHRDTTENG